MSGPAELAGRAMGARLDAGSSAPLAVAFSGGGDSLALLLMAKTWADKAGRRLIAFTVDHRLQVESGEWALWCARRAARLDIDHRTLIWHAEKPATGLASAARAARHRLIADAARDAGARVTLFGHTADDVLEAAAMRADGARVSAPRSWTPSPVWPEGRGQFILRTLIEVRRAAIRDWLASLGETWIEDPANVDMRHARARARARIAETSADPVARPCSPGMLPAATFWPSGDVCLPSTADDQTSDFVDQLAISVLCAAGGERPPRREAVERLAKRLSSGEAVDATLGGARVVRAGQFIHLARETRDRRGRRCEAVTLPANETIVWDGRFEVRALAAGLTLAQLAGHAAKLGADVRKRLAAFHPVIRAAMPALIDASGHVACPTIAPDPRIEIRNLIPARMAGASGAIAAEDKVDLFA
ncbi:MAG: tRNA lysidine(34) synthetase TilS [Caulobacteraceae bacterium]